MKRGSDRKWETQKAVTKETSKLQRQRANTTAKIKGKDKGHIQRTTTKVRGKWLRTTHKITASMPPPLLTE